MKKIVWTALFLFNSSVWVLAQENITITTQYPSPYGSYQDLSVSRDLMLQDSGGTASNVTLQSNATGDFVIKSAGLYNLVFDDSAGKKPYAFLLHYAGAVGSCPAGYVPVGYLNDNKTTPSFPGAPAPGYVICVRGWQE